MNHFSADMKKVMIFGCGQAGSMVAKWLSADCELLGFIDSDQRKWNGTFCGKKIFSLADAIGMEPELIWISILNREACGSIENQLKRMGYEGEILNITLLRDIADLRLATLRLTAGEIRSRGINGEIAELGVYQGRFAAEMNRLFPEKKCYLFDTFEGFDEEDVAKDAEIAPTRAKAGDFGDTSVERVLARLPNPGQAVICTGRFPEALKQLSAPLPEFCLVSLDTDLYEPTYQGLMVFYPLMNKGGVILVHDYNSTQFPGVGEAVRRFCRETDVHVMPLCDLHGAGMIMK